MQFFNTQEVIENENGRYCVNDIVVLKKENTFTSIITTQPFMTFSEVVNVYPKVVKTKMKGLSNVSRPIAVSSLIG